MVDNNSEDSDFYLENLRVLANILFALCMFASVLKIEFTPADLSEQSLIDLLARNSNSIFSFVVAFAFLAMYWVKFIAKLHYIRKTNSILLGLLLMYLAVLCLYPFAENLLGNNPGNLVAQITFSGLWATIGMLAFLDWWYAARAQLIDPSLPETTSRRLFYELFPEPVFALLSIPFAFVADWAFFAVMLLIIPANLMIAKRFPH